MCGPDMGPRNIPGTESNGKARFGGKDVPVRRPVLCCTMYFIKTSCKKKQ